MSGNLGRIILVGIILILALNAYYNYPREFEKDYNGIEYRIGDDQYQEEISIKIEGLYRKRLLRNDRFEGFIIIGNSRLPKVKLNLQSLGEKIYRFSERTYGRRFLGYIYIGEEFESFTVCVYENGDESEVKGWNSNNRLVISAPAENREEALALTNQLLKGK